MNSIDLIRFLKGDAVTSKYFGGIFPANFLLDIVPRYPSIIIANTDQHTGPGKHWVAFYFSSDKCGEFFDSYGHTPSFYHRAWKDWLKHHSVSWTYNHRVIQPSYSITCGLHCLFFLYHRCLGLSMKQVQQLYTRDRDVNDRIAELDLESHTHQDIVIKNKDFIINQLSIALSETL